MRTVRTRYEHLYCWRVPDFADLADLSDLADIVDLERYPIHTLGVGAGSVLLAECRAALAADGVCSLPGFLTAPAVAVTVAAAERLAPQAWASDNEHTVTFVPSADDAAGDDPLAMLQHSAKRAIAYDLLDHDLPVRRLFEADEMTRFIGAVLGKDPLYRSADPLDALELALFGPGEELGWHFDNSEYSVTIMLQPAHEGGDFDFVRDIRPGADGDGDALRATLAGHGPPPQRLATAAGTLAVFRGRDALHRVTPVIGTRPRINAVLTYGEQPNMVLTPVTQMLFYGRNVAAG